MYCFCLFLTHFSLSHVCACVKNDGQQHALSLALSISHFFCVCVCVCVCVCACVYNDSQQHAGRCMNTLSISHFFCVFVCVCVCVCVLMAENSFTQAIGNTWGRMVVCANDWLFICLSVCLSYEARLWVRIIFSGWKTKYYSSMLWNRFFLMKAKLLPDLA